MMAVSTVLGLMRGRPAGSELLQTCRLDGFGTAAYGREAILALVRGHSPEGGEPSVRLASPTAAAVLMDKAPGGATAMFADLYGDNIGRLWRLGPAVQGVAREMHVDVPADVRLDQRCPVVHFDAAHHIDLSREHADAVAAGAATLAAEIESGTIEPVPDHRLLRANVFVRRAFTGDRGWAALYWVRVLTAGPQRRPLAFNAAHFGMGGETRLVLDHAGIAEALGTPWTPRV